MVREAPEDIEFEVDRYFGDPHTIYLEDGTRVSRRIEPESRAILQVYLPNNLFEQDDYYLAIVSHLRQRMQEWEQSLKEPNYTGQEPQIGGKGANNERDNY